MGSYITLGFVCDKSITKEGFLSIVYNTIERNAQNISGLYFKYPTNKDCTYWNETQEQISNLKEILEICFENDLAELKFDYLDNNIYKEILLNIQKIKNDSFGLYIAIPEYNFKYDGIDNLELKITKKLEDIIELGYGYVFCDHEADIEYPIQQVVQQKDMYSILIINNDSKTYHANWKIDGLSSRIK